MQLSPPFLQKNYMGCVIFTKVHETKKVGLRKAVTLLLSIIHINSYCVFSVLLFSKKQMRLRLLVEQQQQSSSIRRPLHLVL